MRCPRRIPRSFQLGGLVTTGPAGFPEGQGYEQDRVRGMGFQPQRRRRRFWHRQSWRSYIKRRSSRYLQAEFPELREQYRGQHMWARSMRQRSRPIENQRGRRRRVIQGHRTHLEPALSRERFKRLQPQCDFQSPMASTGFQPVVINGEFQRRGRLDMRLPGDAIRNADRGL
jgi:hypothetical protein